MIELKELLTSPCDNKEHLENLSDLLVKLNKMRLAYGKPLKVTSGYRSMADHLRIYAEKGITDPNHIPMKSKHLYGQAADLVPMQESIADFHEWIIIELDLIKEIGLWMESFDATKTWTHFQMIAPLSGNRFFKP